jgi:hypothetical protein
MAKLTKVMTTKGTFSRRNILDPTESRSPSRNSFEAPSRVLGLSLPLCDPGDGGKCGNTRCEMQELATLKFHWCPQWTCADAGTRISLPGARRLDSFGPFFRRRGKPLR